MARTNVKSDANRPLSAEVQAEEGLLRAGIGQSDRHLRSAVLLLFLCQVVFFALSQRRLQTLLRLAGQRGRHNMNTVAVD